MTFLPKHYKITYTPRLLYNIFFKWIHVFHENSFTTSPCQTSVLFPIEALHLTLNSTHSKVRFDLEHVSVTPFLFVFSFIFTNTVFLSFSFPLDLVLRRIDHLLSLVRLGHSLLRNRTLFLLKGLWVDSSPTRP